MDELACFAPGMLALGASGYESPEKSEEIMNLAKEVSSLGNLHFVLLKISSLGLIHMNFLSTCLSNLFFPSHSCHSLLGPVIISTKPLPRSWLERTTFSVLDRFMASLVFLFP
jgi:hypothetical protein